MRSVRLHARIVALVLFVLGAGSVLWQTLVQDIPLTVDETDPVWMVDVRVQFKARENLPAKLTFHVPPENGNFAILSESFVGGNYGVSVINDTDNRIATWSTRRATGDQILYYRLALAQRFMIDPPRDTGPQFRPLPQLGDAEQVALQALLEPIRERSADVQTFISETIRVVNDGSNHNVRLLLAGQDTVEQRARVIDLLLASAHIPSQQVHTIELSRTSPQKPELWLRTYTGRAWLYFNPVTLEQGLPSDHLIWWIGPQPLADIEGGGSLQTRFTVSRSDVNSLQLAQTVLTTQNREFLGLSLYDMPLEAQQTFRILFMIPLGVVLILILRNLVGLETLGTFTPVLVALAFRETDLVWGVIMFSLITFLGLSLRSYLDHLKLQLLPRLSLVLTFVVIAITLVTVLGHRLGYEKSLSITLFPMVILTMVIERLSIVWEERGGLNSMKVAFGTLVAASCAYWLMTQPLLIHFFFTFPGVLLVLMSFMLIMGHYRGYRLMELLRFRALVKER